MRDAEALAEGEGGAWPAAAACGAWACPGTRVAVVAGAAWASEASAELAGSSTRMLPIRRAAARCEAPIPRGACQVRPRSCAMSSRAAQNVNWAQPVQPTAASSSRKTPPVSCRSSRWARSSWAEAQMTGVAHASSSGSPATATARTSRLEPALRTRARVRAAGAVGEWAVRISFRLRVR
ncbi:hypothetical protein [Streptomyces sp. NPDC000618]|uniref:hypothetical protein n=1 Tax=Streptomyces sp. NPDC000618 TaxID=3154265 RepID=UPI003331B212